MLTGNASISFVVGKRAVDIIIVLSLVILLGRLECSGENRLLENRGNRSVWDCHIVIGEDIRFPTFSSRSKNSG